jgi:ribonuclease E
VSSAWSAPSDTSVQTEAVAPPAAVEATEASAPTYGTAPVAHAETAPLPAQSADEDEPQAPVERPARRRRHGKVVRAAGAPTQVVTPAAEISVPPVPEGQSRVLGAPEESLNGHEAQASAVAAPEAAEPAAVVLPRRHQPRRAVSRPAGPPVDAPGEPS